MKKELPLYVLLLFLLLQPLLLKSQNNQDFLIWSGYKLKKTIAPGTSIRFRQEIRLRNNASEVQKGLAEVEIRYKFNKYLSVGMSYRNSQIVQREFVFSSRHRMVTDLILKNKWKPVELSYRMRYQLNYRDIFTSENGRVPEQLLRHKFQAEIDLDKRWAPYVATEFFNIAQELPSINSVQNRFRFGIDYELNRNNSISVFYMFRTTHINTPEADYILGIRLYVSL